MGRPVYRTSNIILYDMRDRSVPKTPTSYEFSQAPFFILRSWGRICGGACSVEKGSLRSLGKIRYKYGSISALPDLVPLFLSTQTPSTYLLPYYLSTLSTPNLVASSSNACFVSYYSHSHIDQKFGFPSPPHQSYKQILY